MEQARETFAESFGLYLAKALVAKKGFRPGTVPEAHVLFDYCEAVLTRADGLSLEIIGIVDREAAPWREFELSKEALEKIGRACLLYAGRTGFRKQPVSIRIIEVGRKPITSETMDRLKRLKSRSPFAKVSISAWALDTTSRTLWTNEPLRGLLTMRAFMKDLMTRPRLKEAELRPAAPPAMPEHAAPYVTYFLLALIVGVFAAEFLFRAGATSGLFDPTIGTLIALGALDRNLVIEGEWWRLFSAPLLHGGLVHLALNGLALFFAGAVFEKVVGRAWFAAIFAVTAICGALASLSLNAPTLISVGASGAIMGLFAAAFAVSYRYPTQSPMRTFLQSGSLRVLIPSLIPLADGLFGQKIDFAAHLGGAMGGVILGLLLVALWSKETVLPPFGRFAWALAAIGFCGVLYGGVQIAEGYAQYTLSSYLIPPEQIPKAIAAAKEKSADLVASYPRDPRSHMYRALALGETGDSAGAEREWSAALAQDKILHTFFKPELEWLIRTDFALTLKGNGKDDEAKQVAHSVCSTMADTRSTLEEAGLCSN